MNRAEGEYNGILCLDCGWVGVSWYTHDYKTCDCNNATMIDGGTDYLRYGGKLMDKVQRVSVIVPKTKKSKK